MYSLNTIRHINAPKAVPAKEDAFSRHCSYHASPKGVVLHSAKHRSTGFIEGAQAKRFLADVQSTNSQTKKDAIVESYFGSVPTGKQRIA